MSENDEVGKCDPNFALPSQLSLEGEIRAAINRHSAENGSNTPDFMLAGYLIGCLNVFDTTVRRRDEWNRRGRVIGMLENPQGQPPEFSKK